MFGAGSTKPGAASTTMSWTAGANTDWAIGAVPIIPEPFINTTTFTQSTALCANLTIAANRNIIVTAYLSNITGTIPANPAISATLRYGATNIITMSSPVYTSATGLLTWTGTIGANMVVPAGAAMALDITNNQSSASFDIDFDSQTKPSKIDLPVSDYINVISVDVFNAASPAGSIITNGLGGRNSYIRSTVTNPFGSSDITSMNFTITPPTSIVSAPSVATAGCTKIFEYVWAIPATSATYQINGLAKQGYENIISESENTTFNACVVCPPVAVLDSASGAGGAPIVIDALSNDYDPNNNINRSTFSISKQPNNGSSYINNGKIVYLPNGTYSGTDTVIYSICDSTGLCATACVCLRIDPLTVDPCSDATKTHTYYIPYPEDQSYIALLASSSTTMPSNNIRTVISITLPYPGMTITWDEWEDGYEPNALNPTQTTTKVWGDGNPYNGIVPGYSNDIIPAGGSIVLDNTMPANPRVSSNLFYDGRDKISASGQVAITQVSGEPTRMPIQAIKTNVTSIFDFGQSFTVPLGQNYPNKDFAYTSLFVRASADSTDVNIDKDNNGTFETNIRLNQGQSYLVNGGVFAGATVASNYPVGVELSAGGIDQFSVRNAPIYPATWYSNVYYTPVPTSDIAGDNPKDSSVVMFYNSLSRPITINWTSGLPGSGTILLPAKTTVRFPLAYSATATYKFVNPTGESFTAIEIVDSYIPGSTGTEGQTYDWSFNLISEARLTDFATTAWAPGSIDGSRNDNPIWVTPDVNTTVYVKYNGNVSGSVGLLSPCGLRYDVAVTLNALNYAKIKDPNDNDQSGIAIYTCNGAKLAAVYGEDPATATAANPSWDVGTTIQPFCKRKLIFANDDYGRTMLNSPVTIPILLNDFGFLAAVDPATVTNTGLLKPKNGTVKINANGTILYTPNIGYVGTDTFEYSVCSTPTQVVCDVATVYIQVSSCPAPYFQNVMAGMVFIDKNKDGINNDDRSGSPGAKVYLYVDGNCNTTIDANELKDSVIVDTSGTYQFVTYPEKDVADNFDGTGGARSCANGTDGNTAWLTDWSDIGDPSTGFCNISQSAANTDADIFKDGSFTNALRMKGPNVSATRSVNLNGATYAFLSFSYRRKSATLTSGETVIVQASSNGTTFGTVFTIAGDGNTDAAYVRIDNQDITAYASANTRIRILTDNNVDDADTVYIDDIVVDFITYPQCYITRYAPSSLPANYYNSTVTQHAFTATSATTCLAPYDFGIAKSNVTISGTLFNDVNGITDGSVNGIAIGTPSGTAMYAYLIDSSGKIDKKTTVNSSTGAYSFSQADIFTAYTLVLSTSNLAVYATPPASAFLPAGWVSVGESFGTNNTGGTGIKSGVSNSTIRVVTAASAVTGVNMGIEQLPTAGGGINSAINPGGNINVTVPANTFSSTTTSSDVSPGTISSMRIAVFPPNTTTLTINGTIYTSSNFPALGVTVPCTSTGQPTQTILVDPFDNFVRIAFSFYVTDNAGKESLLPGTAILQLLTDNDRDNIADGNDIDDDNDGITDFIEVCGNGATTFACLSGGSDPSADNDNDGIINHKDPDFGVLNPKGCVASLDKDSDGVPDYLDSDSDNDGIPDVVEAFGVDVNGDGVIDNYSDTDGDGLSQNVDGNNTGASGSGFGLGFVDTDSDGVPNAIDLDSDNDGIPDIVEALLVDVNNDGRLDVFVDANGNGLNDTNELSGSVLKSGPDTNNDGRAESWPNKNADKSSYANPYDIDSDGDGIVDAIEAGFPYYVGISNGKINGPAINGWATAILSLEFLNLVNSDSRGPLNFLDIDSDDDGISDNVEGQPTFSYNMAGDTDTDGDGLVNAFDVSPNAFGGSGITPYDHDFDGQPDYIDLDTDNDGAQDIMEASKIFSLNYGNLITADTDGDGLVDQYDILNLNTLALGDIYKNVSSSTMGTSGTWSGPLPSGSNVKLVRSLLAGDRDWRSISILPLSILSFTGTLINNIANLVWLVENEQDVAHYNVERSIDGLIFETIGTVISKNLASTEYKFADDVRNINSFKYYYRIVQVNKSGSTSTSNVVRFKKDAIPGIAIKLYPNPLNDYLNVSITSSIRQPAKVLLIDAGGKIVDERLIQLEKGQNSTRIDNLVNLSKGMYLVKIITVENTYVEKVLKE